MTTTSGDQVAYFSYATRVVIYSNDVTIPTFPNFAEWTWVINDFGLSI